jgi:UDP-xylose:glucoside alpha-1,3-xylosyltransferase
MVACGNRVEEALTSMRSAVLSAAQPERLFFHILHNEETNGTHVVFQKVLTGWTKQQTFRFALYHAHVPHAYSKLFTPCSSQRLFLHNVLPPFVERVIYLDTDTLLLDDIGILYRDFISSNRLAAMSAEHEAAAQAGHYRDEAQHPYYNQNGVHGLNSGVLLMDLDRIRQTKDWSDQLESFRLEYQDRLVFGDQDLLNLYFHQYPKRLHLLESCRWNYRIDHCYFRSHCPDHDGKISLLHGNRGVFHKADEEKWSVGSFFLSYRVFRVLVTEINRVTLDLGNCGEALRTLDQAASSWLKTVSPAHITKNNCQATALPAILDTFHKSCQRIEEAKRIDRRPEL